MDVLKACRDFDEEPPDFVFFEGPFILHFEEIV